MNKLAREKRDRAGANKQAHGTHKLVRVCIYIQGS